MCRCSEPMVQHINLTRYSSSSVVVRIESELTHELASGTAECTHLLQWRWRWTADGPITVPAPKVVTNSKVRLFDKVWTCKVRRSECEKLVRLLKTKGVTLNSPADFKTPETFVKIKEKVGRDHLHLIKRLQYIFEANNSLRK